MSERIVVGAGLAGLCAAINLRREGHEVRVLERRDSVGGPARDMSTGELTYVMADAPHGGGKLRYIDRRLPRLYALKSARIYSWQRFDTAFPDKLPAVAGGAGSRKDSMDMYLYRIAVDEGVEFEFNFPLKTRRDFDDLPPKSIIAAGLFEDAYKILDIPYVRVDGLFGQGMVADDYDGPSVILYMDRHTWDYAFFSTIHGGGSAALPAQETPVAGGQGVVPRPAREGRGIEFPDGSNWNVGCSPWLHNNRGFSDRFILAGTLAGPRTPCSSSVCMGHWSPAR